MGGGITARTEERMDGLVDRRYIGGISDIEKGPFRIFLLLMIADMSLG